MRQATLALFVSISASFAFAEPAFKGMSYTSFNPTVLSSTGSDQSLLNMSVLGTDTVAINFWWYQSDIFSNSMGQANNSATAESVADAIDYAHGLGMKVFLKPMLDVSDGTWRANIEPSDPDLWFQNYTDYLGQFADMAEEKGVELFSIGCELNRLEAAGNTQRWTDLISNMRSRYNGGLTYAANWNDGGIGGGYEVLPWWDQLDYVGIDAYFPVTDSATSGLAQMQASWQSRADLIEQWRIDRNLTDKQVLFTEVGLGSWNGSNITPWELPPGGATADEIEQANAYEALLSVMTEREWWDGAFWWNWETNPNGGGATGFTPQHKLVQDVLAQYYGGMLPALPVSSWNTDGNGSAGTGFNWSNGVPNQNFVANFDRGEGVAYELQLNTNTRTVDQIRVRSNILTLTSNNATVRNLTADDWHGDDVNRGLIVGVDAGDVAVVNTTSTFGTLTARAATIGDAAGSSGTVNLIHSNNRMNIIAAHPEFWEFIVGRAGTGVLNISGGARVAVNGIGASSAMGVETGSSGTATVTGIGSLWSTSIALRVGIEGVASLTVSDGGQVSAPSILVGTLGEVRGNGTLTGNVTSSGLISPGTSPGPMTITGNFTGTATGNVLIELASLSAIDRLLVGGNVTLGGTVTVLLIDDYLPKYGDVFDILDWGNTFNDAGYTLELPDLIGNRAWDTSQFETSGKLSIVDRLTGDYNGDGVVNAADYTVWRDSSGEMGDDLAADGNHDGEVNYEDFSVWKMHFGEMVDIGGGGLSALGDTAQFAVPEPTSLFLINLVGIALLACRSASKRR